MATLIICVQWQQPHHLHVSIKDHSTVFARWHHTYLKVP